MSLVVNSRGVRERYLSAVVAVQQMLLERSAGPDFANILPILGAAAGADRAYFYGARTGPAGPTVVSLRSQWTRPGIPRDDELTDVSAILIDSAMPDVAEKLRRGQEVNGLTSDMVGGFREILDATQVLSVLLLPVLPDGEFAGLLGFDHCSTSTPWSAEEVELLRAAATAVAVAIGRERAEARLDDALHRLQRHIDQSPLAVVEWDHELRVTFWSHQAEAIFGWTAAEVMSRPWPEWRFVHDDDQPRVRQIAEGLARGTTPRSVSFNRNYTKSGEVRHCEWYNSILRKPDGTPSSTLSLVLDVTERVRTEEELRRSQSLAANNEKMAALGQMASGVAHDFNNALTVILGKTELALSKPDLPERARMLLREVLAAGTDAAGTVKRMQQFVRNQPVVAPRRSVDLTAVARAVLDEVRGRWSELAHDATRHIEFQEELGGPAVIAAEPREIRELITAVIANAIDAMPNGGTLSVGTAISGGRAVLTIRDTGFGMSPETLRRCFEPFFTTKGIEAAGLGLAVSWSTARRLGGELRAESLPSEGTTVTLTIAQAGGTSVAHPVASPAGPIGLHILVIDDRVDVTHTVCQMLGLLGHRAEAVATGQEGIDRVAGEQFDAVITDLGMPFMDGRAVAALIKDIRPTLPVLLLTGWADELSGADAIPPGVDAVIGKPISIEQLRAALGTVATGGHAGEKRVPSLSGITGPP